MWLALESSCDESALALMSKQGELLGEWIHSQVDRHAEYGGVVPDLAVGEHLNNFVPLLKLASEEFDLPKMVTSIAVTRGPGLVGCLGIGISYAKTLGLLWNVPVFGVNHLRGHAFSVFMPSFLGNHFEWQDYMPHLGLLVSGGNTVLFSLDISLDLKVIAETVDDAAGEALDKGAKLLGMPYPGGAKMEESAKDGNPKAFDFPLAFPEKNELKFSFSGLKTSLLYKLNKWTESEVELNKADLSASYQKAVVDQLVRKTGQVISPDSFKSFGLSGGVANNELIRSEFGKLCQDKELKFLPAEKRHTGDNAAMIAFAAISQPSGMVDNAAQSLTFLPSLRIDH